MSELKLWSDDKNLTDLDPEDMEEAVSWAYNLHEDVLVMKERLSELEQQLKEARSVIKILQGR